MDSKTITLTNGGITVVDAEDYQWASKRRWSHNNKGYVRQSCNTNGARSKKLHRLVLDLTDPKIHVDHVNGDKLDNRRSNLRTCTVAENNRNVGPRGSMPYKGVYRCGSMYESKARRPSDSGVGRGALVYLGLFDTPEEAARAYDRFAAEFYGEFARLNFPDEGQVRRA